MNDKLMTKQELATEIMAITQKARAETLKPDSRTLNNFMVLSDALNNIESICFREALDDALTGGVSEERVREIFREEMTKATCIRCAKVAGRTIDGRCLSCHASFEHEVK